MKWIFKASKLFMKRFGNIVYNAYIKRFKSVQARMYYIRPNNLKDVKVYLKENMQDELIKELAEKYKGMEPDEMVIKILRDVKSRLTYFTDYTLWRVPEYWQDVKTTWENRTGDCEDGVIVIFCLARLAGIPANRIFLTAGWVEYRSELIGHAYITYLADNGSEYILDWCYYYDSRSIKFRPERYNLTRYQKIWFLVNDFHSLRDYE